MFDVILSNTLKRLDFAKELFDASYNAEEYFELWTSVYISRGILNPKRLVDVAEIEPGSASWPCPLGPVYLKLFL